MSSIKVILMGDSPHLGKFGDVVSVKRGYARNHLLPSGIARTYTAEAMAEFEREKKKILKERKEERGRLEELHSQLDGYLLQSVYQAQESGALYGSVTQSGIADLLSKQGFSVKRNQVRLPGGEPIKSVGEHEVVISVAPDLSAKMRFSALSDSD